MACIDHILVANTPNGINGSPPRLPERQPETGIDVLIVGSGPAGLVAALECWRKGHNVTRILERASGPVYTGLFLLHATIGVRMQS